jgi:hypothetical protein
VAVEAGMVANLGRNKVDGRRWREEEIPSGSDEGSGGPARGSEEGDRRSGEYVPSGSDDGGIAGMQWRGRSGGDSWSSGRAIDQGKDALNPRPTLVRLLRFPSPPLHLSAQTRAEAPRLSPSDFAAANPAVNAALGGTLKATLAAAINSSANKCPTVEHSSRVCAQTCDFTVSCHSP